MKDESTKNTLKEFREYIYKISKMKKDLNQNMPDIGYTDELIKFLIKKGLLNSIELSGIENEPWFLDLSKIETWIKLDPQQFIQNFAHLFSCENFILSPN